MLHKATYQVGWRAPLQLASHKPRWWHFILDLASSVYDRKELTVKEAPPPIVTIEREVKISTLPRTTAPRGLVPLHPLTRILPPGE